MSAVHYIIDGNKYESSSNALASSIEVDEETGKSAMSLEKNETAGYYTIKYDEEEDLSGLKTAIKQELNEEKGYNLSDDVLDFLAVLVDNGENLDNYKSEEELKALYFFYKTEVASLALDIRPEDKMFENPKTQTDYIQPTNTIDGNQIYGIVRVRREHVKEVNVADDSSIVLKEYLTYKNYEDFQKIIEGDDDAAKVELLNYFSIDEEGNLIIARWGFTRITYEYSYYDVETGKETEEAKAKFADKDEYNSEEKYSITTFTKVPYKQLIPKHSMPYELLVATMIKSDTVEFAEELAEVVNSNTITITLQESLSQTDTILENTYTKTFRTYEWITYELKATKNESKSFTGTSTVSELQAKSNAGNSAVAWVKENNIVNPQYSYTTNKNSGGGTWVYSISIIYNGYPYTKTEGGFSSQNDAYNAAEQYLTRNGLKGTISTNQETAPTTTYSATCTVSGYKQSTTPKEHEKVIFDNGEEYYDKTYAMKESITTFAQNNTYKLEVTEVDNWYMFYKRAYKYDDEGEPIEFTASKPADEPFYEYDTDIMKEEPEDTENLEKWKEAYEYYEGKLNNFKANNSSWDTSKSSLNSVEFKTDLEQKYTSDYTKNNSIKYEFEETITEIKLKMHQEEPNENVENWDNIKDSIYVDEDGNCFLQVYDEHTEARHKLTTDYQAFFEMLEENSKTVVLVDIIKYMMYLYDGKDYGVTSIDLNLFKPREFNLFGSGISPLGCPLTREEFINAAESYNCALSPWAADFYDVCMKEEYNVNPCLAFAWACLETGYGEDVPYNNLFGMAIYNGQTSGTRYSSYADSIEDFCKWVINVSTEGSTAYVASYNQGQDFAEVNPKFKGTPSQNIYVLFCRYMYLGDTHISPETSFSNPAGHNYYVANGSNWTSGGRIYLYYMYELGGLYEGEYATRCGHLNGTDPTTTQERADYVEYSVNQRIDIAKTIFGDNCFFGGSGGEFVANDDTTYIRGWYTSSFGKRFTIFNQCVFSGLSGRCNRAAWMSVVSGYSPYESGSDLDVLEHYFANTFSVNTPPNSYFNSYGAKTYAAPGFSRNGDYTEQLKEELMKGNQSIIWVSTNGQDNVGYIDRNGHQWTGRFHWMAVLDYRVSENGEEQMFISCSAGNTGWWPLDIFIGGTTKSGAVYGGTSAVYYMYFVTEN